jgi:hypothetical protein
MTAYISDLKHNGCTFLTLAGWLSMFPTSNRMAPIQGSGVKNGRMAAYVSYLQQMAA